MKTLLASFILSLLIGAVAIAQQKGVLQEGYHMPGAIYSQPSYSQPNVNSNQDNYNSKIKQDYISESSSLKKKYDTCMIEHDRMPNPKNAFDFSKSLKHKECKQYYDRYMDLTSKIIQLEQAGY